MALDHVVLGLVAAGVQVRLYDLAASRPLTGFEPPRAALASTRGLAAQRRGLVVLSPPRDGRPPRSAFRRPTRAPGSARGSIASRPDGLVFLHRALLLQSASRALLGEAAVRRAGSPRRAAHGAPSGRRRRVRIRSCACCASARRHADAELWLLDRLAAPRRRRLRVLGRDRRLDELLRRGREVAPSLWMMPSGRMKVSSVIGMAISDLLRTSGRTAAPARSRCRCRPRRSS